MYSVLLEISLRLVSLLQFYGDTGPETKNICIMLVFVRPRVESRLTIHCKGLRGRSIADCESRKMSLKKIYDMMESFGTCRQCGT